MCDSTIMWNGAACTISDPMGNHVYNPVVQSSPPWVTETTYLDPQDGSAAQFIVARLVPGVLYAFRVRTYSGNTNPVYSGYSNTVFATTSAYPRRYVSTAGNDANEGAGPDPKHAWRSLSHGSASLACGQVLIVAGGSYANDSVNMAQTCSATAKAVILADPASTATLTSSPSGAAPVSLSGSYLVVDGLASTATSTGARTYAWNVSGNHIALFGVDVGPPVIPTFTWGVLVLGDHNLVYGSYLHDWGSPDSTQNPYGNGGFVLALYLAGATGNVIWSNHLTRGGHDESLCKAGCDNNRWLNNIMDGGWGQGWAIAYGNDTLSQNNLVEGNTIKDIGQLVSFYKPSIQVSQPNNTVRRNIILNEKSNAFEVSALDGSVTVNVLIYNNVVYGAPNCLFQSASGGVTAYDGNLFVNNICFPISQVATDIYLANMTNTVAYNDLLFADNSGNPQPNQRIVIWNHSAQGSFQYPTTVAFADANYAPPFSHNAGLNVVPGFVDAANFDFHLAGGSSLVGAGTAVTDSTWGSTSGAVDLGAFGIKSVAAALPR